MTQQKSEGGVVPAGRGNSAPTRGDDKREGGKAIPVEEQVEQLGLPFVPAENLVGQSPTKASRRRRVDRSTMPSAEAPLADGKSEPGPPATMKGVTMRLTEALRRVAANRGAPGPDGMRIGEVQKRWPTLLPKLVRDLLEGTYMPDAVRQAMIPKGKTGQRKLGIPNVIDRVVQEAVRHEIEPLFEPSFHPSSHGFRPGRSCHSAIREAVGYLEDGAEWVVDLDMEKFFDRVNHQRLMARLALRVEHKPLLVLIGKMLKAGVVLPDGVVVTQDEGVPQGGPLSPLLSNVVLDELDHELTRRGHRFVRYADDINIFVGSERAGQRVMASATAFIEGRMRLKVNVSKSAVARPDDRHFLGFSLRRDPQTGVVEIHLSKRSRGRIAEKIVDLTRRNWGQSFPDCIQRINAYTRGWIGFFGICSEVENRKLQTLDAHIRRRLRALKLKHWKRRRSIVRALIAMGANPRTAWRRIYAGKRRIWDLSHDHVVDRALDNAYFRRCGLLSLAVLHKEMLASHRRPRQRSLFAGIP